SAASRTANPAERSTRQANCLTASSSSTSSTVRAAAVVVSLSFRLLVAPVGRNAPAAPRLSLLRREGPLKMSRMVGAGPAVAADEGCGRSRAGGRPPGVGGLDVLT